MRGLQVHPHPCPYGVAYRRVVGPYDIAYRSDLGMIRYLVLGLWEIAVRGLQVQPRLLTVGNTAGTYGPTVGNTVPT